jgi:hypothetical protein
MTAGAYTSIPPVHAHVTHAKLPELGVGEIVSSDGARVAIRFASGERNFIYSLVAQHLAVTTEAPPPSVTKKAPRAKKAAAAKPAVAAAAKPAVAK